MIYERVIELMGTNPEDPLFAKFIEDLNDPPVIFLDNLCSTEYQFANTGLEISFMKGPGCFTYAYFHFRRPKIESIKTRWKKHYSGNLPGGVSVDDSPEDIKKKLGATPKFPYLSSDIFANPQSKEARWSHLVCELTLFKLTWTIRTIDQKLSMLCLCYKPGNDWITQHGTGPSNEKPKL